MMIHDITAKVGPTRRSSGSAGPGSGAGKMSGRGHKGGGARAGCSGRTLAEGGGLPLFRRIPIRGSLISTSRPSTSRSTWPTWRSSSRRAQITVADIVKMGLARLKGGKVKVLGGGAMAKKLIVTADAFSDSAAKKIVEAGGQVNDLSGQVAARAKERIRAVAQRRPRLRRKPPPRPKPRPRPRLAKRPRPRPRGRQVRQGEGKGEGKPKGEGNPR